MQSDKRLLKLFRRGVGPAFDELVSRYRAPLVGYASAIVGRDRAEDVVQDSLIKAHKALLSDQEIEPKPWLYKVVRNTALNDIRDNKKHGHDELDETTVGIEQPQQVAERRAELAGVVAAISDLPDAQRKALIGRELGGFSHEEIASELRVSTGATKQLIHRARLNVRNAMGALIPIPLIAWLAASGSSAAGAAGAAGGVTATGGGAAGAGTTGTAAAAAAGGTAAATGSAAGGGAAAGGALAGLGSAGLAKVAVVAVIAGGGVAGGVAVKRSAEQPATADSPALEASSDSGSANGKDAIDGAGGDRSGSRQDEGSGSGSGPGAGSSGGGDPSEEETLDGSEDESPRGDDGSGGGKEDKGGSGDKGGCGGDKGGSGGGGGDKGGSGGGKKSENES